MSADLYLEEKFVDLRARYDAAFRLWRQAVELRDDDRVEAAQVVYWRARNDLAEFLLERIGRCQTAACCCA